MIHLRSNIFIYHAASLLLGIAFFYSSEYGINIVGSLIAPVFEYYQPPDSFIITMLMNYVLALFGALIPAIFIIMIAYSLLIPETKLFLVTLSLSLISITAWSMYSSYYIHFEIRYIYPLGALALGELSIIWLLTSLYIKIKSNQRSVNAT